MDGQVELTIAADFDRMLSSVTKPPLNRKPSEPDQIEYMPREHPSWRPAEPAAALEPSRSASICRWTLAAAAPRVEQGRRQRKDEHGEDGRHNPTWAEAPHSAQPGSNGL